MKTLPIAAIQLTSTRDKKANLSKAESLMDKAVEQGAKLLALPENFSYLGEEGEKLDNAEDLKTGESVQFLSQYAKSNGITIIGGSVPLIGRQPGKVTNTCLLFDTNGHIKARYDKIHLFNIKLDEKTTFTESDYVEAGNRVVTSEVLEWTIGLSICYDLRFPEFYRALSKRAARVLFIPSAFTVPTGEDHWEILLRARAIENQCFIVAPAQWGQHTPTRSTYGHSMIIDPWGEILAQQAEGEGVVFANLDSERLVDIRKRLPALRHKRHH